MLTYGIFCLLPYRSAKMVLPLLASQPAVHLLRTPR